MERRESYERGARESYLFMVMVMVCLLGRAGTAGIFSRREAMKPREDSMEAMAVLRAV